MCFAPIQQTRRKELTRLLSRSGVPSFDAMLEAFIPSLIIVASTVAAFIAGRVVAWGAARLQIMRVARVIVILLAIGFALFFWFSPASRYALLLPAAFAVGFLAYGGRRIAPGVFDGDR